LPGWLKAGISLGGGSSVSAGFSRAGAAGGVAARGEAELDQHGGSVVLGRPGRDDQPTGGVGVRAAGGGPFEHFERGETMLRCELNRPCTSRD
jgi:hypothetical protein